MQHKLFRFNKKFKFLDKSGLLSFLGGQTPNCIILIILLFLIIAYYNPYNISYYFYKLRYNIAYIISLFLLSEILGLVYYIICFLLLELTFNNKLIISKNLPKLIRSRLLFYSKLTNEHKLYLSRDFKTNIYV